MVSSSPFGPVRPNLPPKITELSDFLPRALFSSVTIPSWTSGMQTCSRSSTPPSSGSGIRAARVAKGWTQTQLAGDDISVGYVSRIESGQRRPNSQTPRRPRHAPRRTHRAPAARRHRARVRRDQADPRLRRALPRDRPAPRGGGPGPRGAGPCRPSRRRTSSSSGRATSSPAHSRARATSTTRSSSSSPWSTPARRRAPDQERDRAVPLLPRVR